MVPILLQSTAMFFTFLRVLLFARIIMSWIALGGGGGGLFRLVYNLTEPLLMPIRNVIHRSPLGGPGMMIDFSVLILFVLLQVGEGIVINLIRSLPM